MNNLLPPGVIHVKDLRLWAHVGVLESERLLGQWFELDFSIWLDLEPASIGDDISSSVDYSKAIEALQKLSFDLNCLSIEHFGKQILDCLESICGELPMKVSLRKCSAPVAGFSGVVEIEMRRNFLPSED